MQKKLAILGGGQLAKMLAIAAKKLNIDIVCFESTSVDNPCTIEVAQVVSVDLSNAQTIADMLSKDSSIGALTIETENIPAALAQKLAETTPFYPSIQALKTAQDRLFEKTLFTHLAIPTPEYFNIEDIQDLLTALEKIQCSAVLKTRTMGYDGKGQAVIKWQGSLEATRPIALSAFKTLSNNTPLILESFIDFDYELSLICARDQFNNIDYYPLTKNTHEAGILRLSEAPMTSPETDILTSQAQLHAQKILHELDYIGVLAIEFFVKDNVLIANEMAPRVHNSGHWTIEGAETSQFENHVRAVCGLPLGPTDAIGFSAMHNIISKPPTTEQLAQLAELPGAYVHLYGKEPRANRKLGHITFCADNSDSLKKLIAEYV